VQEAEQTLPHFVQSGFDFGDWVEVFAPKPYAIVSTTSDMFPFEGARKTYEEAKRIYGLYGAADRLQWLTGPGGHGALTPIGPAILTFFTRHLKGSAEEATFTPMRVDDPKRLICTPTGQVATSLGGETVYSLNKKRADGIRPATRDLKEDIRVLTGVSAKREPLTVESSKQKDGFRVEKLNGAIAAIPDGKGKKDAVVLMSAQPAEGELERIVKSGRIAVVVDARPVPAGTESVKSPYLGSYNLLALRAFLVGKTLVGLRVDDVLRAVDWLSARPDVGAIVAQGDGPVLLHAAVLDSRIQSVQVEHSIASYRAIVDDPLPKNVSEAVIPGVLLHYDLPDLVRAIAPRKVTVLP